jgi:hypothetical protein
MPRAIAVSADGWVATSQGRRRLSYLRECRSLNSPDIVSVLSPTQDAVPYRCDNDRAACLRVWRVVPPLVR